MAEVKGSFRAIRRSFITKDNDDQRACYMAVDGRVSIPDLIAHLEAVAPGTPIEAFGLNFATVAWVDEATEDERRDRAAWRAEWAERHEQWERETYERLRLKFEAAEVDR
jgi:hypothetical protein